MSEEGKKSFNEDLPECGEELIFRPDEHAEDEM